MVVAHKASSQTGITDAFVTSVAVPVPTGAAANDIVVVNLEQWESANPAVTPPAGFTALTVLVSGSQKLKPFWKRLTGADTGNYTFTWTGSQWSMAHAELFSGGITTGDPVEATNTATATSTSIPSTTVTTLTEPFLAHLVANENAATGTPPTNYTETRDGDYCKTNYRVPAAVGVHIASGGTISTSSLVLAYLIAFKPDAGGSTQTVVVQVISAGSTLFNPTIIQIIQVPTINTSTIILTPKVDQIINTSTISAPSTILNPKIDQIVQTISITTSSTIFNPSVIRLLQVVEVVGLQAPTILFNPSVSGGEGADMPGSISDVARANMLTNRALTEPQTLSNVDLMRLVLADDLQTLVTETEATAAVHLWRYLKQVRDTV